MEWYFWLIVGILIGGVLVYWLCTRSKEDKAEMAPTTSRIADLPAAAAAPEPDPVVAAPEPVDPDDLTKIEGIGPKIGELVNDGGIMTFAQLAAAPVERLQELLDAGGPRYQVHNPASWPMQAGLAAEGKWDALDELQDRLDGGKIN
jgi:hypothetical protein